MKVVSFNLEGSTPAHAVAVAKGMEMGRISGSLMPATAADDSVYYLSAFVVAMTATIAERFNDGHDQIATAHMELILETVLQLQTLAGSAKTQEVDSLTTPEDHLGINGAPPQPISSLFKRP